MPRRSASPRKIRRQIAIVSLRERDDEAGHPADGAECQRLEGEVVDAREDVIAIPQPVEDLERYAGCRPRNSLMATKRASEARSSMTSVVTSTR